MIKIDSIAYPIYTIDIPTKEPIRTYDLQVGNIVESREERFKILSVSLTHQLLDLPIPKLVLKCRKIDQ